MFTSSCFFDKNKKSLKNLNQCKRKQNNQISWKQKIWIFIGKQERKENPELLELDKTILHDWKSIWKNKWNNAKFKHPIKPI